MLKPNIKEVYFFFDLSSVVGSVLDATSNYSPSKVKDELQSRYSFNAPAASDRDVMATLHFSNDRDIRIDVRVSEYQDYTADDFDFDNVAKTFAEFTIDLPSVLGPKDWEFYRDNKVRKPQVYVPSWVNAKLNDAEDANFHEYLSAKLGAFLKEKGFSHIDDSMALPETFVPRLLIGMAVHYHTLCKNPDLLHTGLEAAIGVYKP